MVRRLARVALSLLYYVFIVLLSSQLSRFLRKDRSCLIVLCYHGVFPDQRQAFAWQMEEILKAGRPVGLGGAIAVGGALRSIAVTFDDAFANLIENALPELEKRGMPATVFVPSASLGRTPHWWMSEGSADASERVMTAEEVRAAVATGLVTIGSHTVSHRALTALSESGLDHELCASRADLETVTGHPVDALAFPYGAYDERVLAHVRRAGYTRAFSVEPTVHRADADEFLMGRVRVEPDDWPLEVWLKLRGGYQWLGLLHRLRRGGKRLEAS